MRFLVLVAMTFSSLLAADSSVELYHLALKHQLLVIESRVMHKKSKYPEVTSSLKLKVVGSYESLRSFLGSMGEESFFLGDCVKIKTRHDDQVYCVMDVFYCSPSKSF